MERFNRLGRLVAAAQQIKQVVIQALDADAQPVDTLIEDPDARSFVQVSGVSLNGYLCCRVDFER